MATQVTFGEAVSRVRAVLGRDAPTLDELGEAGELLRAAAELAEEYETARRALPSVVERQKGVLAEFGGMLRAQRRAARGSESAPAGDAATDTAPRRAH